MRLDLAVIFKKIHRTHGAMEATASQILEVVRVNDAKSLDQFNDLVATAYDQNGWSRRVGRPLQGDVSAPAVIQVYVSTLRRAYRLGLAVLKCNNMEEVRRGIRNHRGHGASDTKGVRLTSLKSLNGDLRHDLLLVWQILPPEEQHALEASVKRLVDKYLKKAPPTLRLVG